MAKYIKVILKAQDMSLPKDLPSDYIALFLDLDRDDQILFSEEWNEQLSQGGTADELTIHGYIGNVTFEEFLGEDDDDPQFDPGDMDEDYEENDYEGMRDPGRDDEYDE